MHIHAIYWCLLTSVGVEHLKLEVQLVDGNFVFSRVILPCSSQEGLGEKEAGYPEHVRFTLFVPILWIQYEFINIVVKLFEFFYYLMKISFKNLFTVRNLSRARKLVM